MAYLREMAREWREQYCDLGSKVGNESVDKMLTSFAEKVLREVIKTAETMPGHTKCCVQLVPEAIRREFGL